MKVCFAGIDVGSTSAKVGLYSETGEILAETFSPYPTRYGEGGISEQDPDVVWRAVSEAVSAGIRQTPGVQVAAVGLAGQNPTLVWVDAAGQALSPCLTWRDVRATREAAELERVLDKALLEQELGIQLPITAGWLPARIAWYARNEPGVVERAAALLSIKDYILLQLTGSIASDAVSMRGLCHFERGTTAEGVVRRLGIPVHLVPPVRKPTAVAGQVTKAAASRTGLAPGTPVVAGWGDLWAALLAAGVLTAPGRTFDVTGTAEGVGISYAGRPVSVAGLVTLPVLDLAVTYGSTQAGAGSVDWFLKATVPGSNPSDHLAELDDQALAVWQETDKILFLPYLGGERAPLWDVNARGVFLGLSPHHTWGHLGCAVMEGVAYSIRHVLELAEAGTAVRGSELRVAGKAARSRVWNLIKASVTGRPVLAFPSGHVTARGAAMLAALGNGAFRSYAEVAEGMMDKPSTVEPDPGMQDLYDDLYPIFRRVYSDLQPAFLALQGARQRRPS